MATKEDTGLVDRRSVRELKETSVGGKRAPLSARKQLEAGARLRKLLKRDAERRKKMKGKNTSKT